MPPQIWRRREFYEQLEAVLDRIPKRNVVIVILMGDMNVRVGSDNSGRSNVTGTHGVGTTVSENGGFLADFCEANELIIGGTLLPHRERHMVTWVAPDGGTQNQMNHILIRRRWKSSLLDVRAMRCGL